MALGRGLGALIPDKPSMDEATSLPALREISTDSIKPNPDQPRTVFNEVKLNELAESIKTHGVIEPIVVVPDGEGFKIVAGERRWRAACLAGLDKIPAVCSKLDDKDLLEMAIIENVQREDLNIIELANGYELLINRLGYTHEELAQKIGISRTAVSNVLRILNLPQSIQKMVASDRLSFGAARALLGLENEEQQERLADMAVEEGLNVRQIEEKVKLSKRKKKPTKPKEVEEDPYMKDIEERLCQRLDTKVSVSQNKQKGKIEIKYSSLDQLNGILGIMGVLTEGT